METRIGSAESEISWTAPCNWVRAASHSACMRPESATNSSTVPTSSLVSTAPASPWPSDRRTRASMGATSGSKALPSAASGPSGAKNPKTRCRKSLLPSVVFTASNLGITSRRSQPSACPRLVPAFNTLPTASSTPSTARSPRLSRRHVAAAPRRCSPRRTAPACSSKADRNSKQATRAAAAGTVRRASMYLSGAANLLGSGVLANRAPSMASSSGVGMAAVMIILRRSPVKTVSSNVVIAWASSCGGGKNLRMASCATITCGSLRTLIS
mmetsp:Transcript_94330/g.215820  ORF Transcript_94330/g.215820 Transcript_94330/m.215820 type:complete len:270 (+) Transcript_94330:294-1103(+)